MSNKSIAQINFVMLPFSNNDGVKRPTQARSWRDAWVCLDESRFEMWVVPYAEDADPHPPHRGQHFFNAEKQVDVTTGKCAGLELSLQTHNLYAISLVSTNLPASRLFNSLQSRQFTRRHLLFAQLSDAVSQLFPSIPLPRALWRNPQGLTVCPTHFCIKRQIPGTKVFCCGYFFRNFLDLLELTFPQFRSINFDFRTFKCQITLGNFVHQLI